VCANCFETHNQKWHQLGQDRTNLRGSRPKRHAPPDHNHLNVNAPYRYVYFDVCGDEDAPEPGNIIECEIVDHGTWREVHLRDNLRSATITERIETWLDDSYSDLRNHLMSIDNGQSDFSLHGKFYAKMRKTMCRKSEGASLNLQAA